MAKYINRDEAIQLLKNYGLTPKRTKRQVAVGKNDPHNRPYGAEAIDSVSTKPYAGEAERVTTLQGGVHPDARIGEVIVNRNGGRLIPRNKKF